MPTHSRPPSPSRAARQLAGLAAELRVKFGEEADRDRGRDWETARRSLEQSLEREVPPHELADIAAQGVSCGLAIVARNPVEAAAAKRWLLDQAEPWERVILVRIFDRPGGATGDFSVAPNIDPAHLYEHFLHHYSRQSRRRSGVFFTPRPVADYIVREVEQLVESGQFPQNRLRVLDPAVGTGVFLLAIVDRAFKERTARETHPSCSDLVPELLARISGIEIMPAAVVLAKLNIAIRLAQAGFRFDGPGRINILLGDALLPQTLNRLDWPADAVPVIVGNPPFAALTAKTNPWMARLVRGDGEVRGYVQANGQRLGERKTWLHDDYVKFLRLVQWLVEQAGGGVVGFVTNHGYLDNATFRLMRHELLRVFPQIRIVDLHGNRKKGEAGPSGDDENVFGLDQGVAIGLFCRPLSEKLPSGSPLNEYEVGDDRQMEYAELWGPAAAKLGRLDSVSDHSLAFERLAPHPPQWQFLPTRLKACREYDAGWSLTDAMPVFTSAPVTARDHFVVAFTEEELTERMAEFRDLSISDDAIRDRYFLRTRSRRYPPGDTRGWKLSAARRIVAADDRWAEHIRRCLYRPLDWRYVSWHPALIDWPRTNVTQHLLPSIRHPPSAVRNLVLITRRQQLPTQPCNFFWIADGLALDGVIRSDNRGSESLFPLYLRDESGAEPTWRANLAPHFVSDVARAAELTWQAEGRGDLQCTLGPEDILAYVYALFHAPRYRERYAPQLHGGFPRVLLPESAQQFRALCQIGRQLIALHLLQDVTPASHASELRNAAQEFRVGGYCVLDKWLKAPGRSESDLHYQRMATAVERTLDLIDEIDR